MTVTQREAPSPFCRTEGGWGTQHMQSMSKADVACTGDKGSKAARFVVWQRHTEVQSICPHSCNFLELFYTGAAKKGILI